MRLFPAGLGECGDGLAFGEGLAVGAVEVAEGLAAEGGGTAELVVGEEVVAGGAGDDGHGGLRPVFQGVTC